MNFYFLDKVNRNVLNNLETAKSEIKKNPKNSINKIYTSLELIINDIIDKEKINIKKKNNKKNTSYTLKEKIDILKDSKVIDLKIEATFNSVRNIYIDSQKNSIIDLDWVNLCFQYINVICKWYANKYYNINTVQHEEKNKKCNIVKDIKTKEVKIDMIKDLDIISHSYAQKAYNYLNIDINNKYDALLFLASVNLINAYVKQDNSIIYIKPKYVFKQILVDKLEDIIRKDIQGIDIYFNKNTTYVKIFNLQFSFKFLESNQFMDKYLVSIKNKKQEWEGISLQPCSMSILKQAETYAFNKSYIKSYSKVLYN